MEFSVNSTVNSGVSNPVQWWLVSLWKCSSNRSPSAMLDLFSVEMQCGVNYTRISKSNVSRFALVRTPAPAPLALLSDAFFVDWDLLKERWWWGEGREETRYLAISSSPASSNTSFLCCFLSKPSCCVIQPAGHSPCPANQSSPLSNESIPANQK